MRGLTSVVDRHFRVGSDLGKFLGCRGARQIVDLGIFAEGDVSLLVDDGKGK